ncbi:MAG: tetratricopeptide repeat protein [Chloroflexi bacterium]|nr:tetratricopeptide repeat protein [Chloroflexota bacterium]
MVQQLKQYPSRPFEEVKSEAVTAALAGNWQEAADLNYEAVELSPEDSGSFNRLATALIELGRFSEARHAAGKALSLDPDNKIARKHVNRLSQLDGTVAAAPVTSGARVAAKFITDSAKATVTELVNPASARVLATVSPGQELQLSDNGVRMELHTRAGERIGSLEVHIAQRVRKLREKNNRYEFSVAKLSDSAIAVMVAETFCAPGMASVVSFPPSLQRSVADFGLDDELIEESDEDIEVVEHEDDDSITPEAERTERLKSIMSGRLGGAYHVEDENLSI